MSGFSATGLAMRSGSRQDPSAPPHKDVTSPAFYFREADKPLFGCYHSPRRDPPRSAAVVLCQPQGCEYIRCHRAFRLLAEQLSRSGFGTLRFDFHASGDSAGESRDGDLRQWVDDVSAAVEECRARSGISHVAAVGLRLGASLALLAQRTTALDALVLWEPVMSGPKYLEELRSQHRHFLRSLPQGGPERVASDDGTELLGFTYSPQLLQQLGALDLSTASFRVARTLVVETSGNEGETRRSRLLSALEQPAEYSSVPSPRIWQLDAYQAFVPHSVLQAIVSWLSEVYS